VRNPNPNPNPSSRSSSNDYESIARREFFANRAAAQAVKAKVEAQERGAGLGLGLGLAEPVRERGVGLDGDAESRIASIRALKERQRDEELAEKERQLQLAHEANRLNRRKLENAELRGVAFEIDISDDPTAQMKRNQGLGLSEGDGVAFESQQTLPKQRGKPWGTPLQPEEIRQKVKEKDKNNNFMLGKKDEQLKVSEELTNRLHKELKGQRTKTFFWKVGTYAGILASTYLIITK
jgi:hypothetical protein